VQDKIWKLSPSDFAFLWRECKRCFYLKIVRGFNRPSLPFPKIFTIIASMEKDFFDEKSTSSISLELSPGKVIHGEKWVCSKPLSFPDVKGSCFIKGCHGSG